MFMGLASIPTLGIAGYCAALGFWPVLPFAGLELSALGFALAVSMRRNAYREVVSFTPTQIVVEFGLAGHGASARAEVPRAWARAWMEPGERPSDAPRLMLGASGQRVEIGRCLTEVEKEELVVRFKSLLRAPSVVPRWQATQMTLGEQ
jgi:uncharacterized membrane protein